MFKLFSLPNARVSFILSFLCPISALLSYPLQYRFPIDNSLTAHFLQECTILLPHVRLGRAEQSVHSNFISPNYFRKTVVITILDGSPSFVHSDIRCSCRFNRSRDIKHLIFKEARHVARWVANYSIQSLILIVFDIACFYLVQKFLSCINSNTVLQDWLACFVLF